MKTDTLTTKPETPAGLSSSAWLACVKCLACNTPLVRPVEKTLCAHCDDKKQSALKRAPWLEAQNTQYLLAFLKNSEEQTRAIRLVMDAAGCDCSIAQYIVRYAWLKWRRSNPLVAG